MEPILLQIEVMKSRLMMFVSLMALGAACGGGAESAPTAEADDELSPIDFCFCPMAIDYEQVVFDPCAGADQSSCSFCIVRPPDPTRPTILRSCRFGDRYQRSIESFLILDTYLLAPRPRDTSPRGQ